MVLRGREQIHAILDREDDRLLVIVGPCSVHDADAALDYARLLAGKSAELGDDLCVAMRVYFEKPRADRLEGHGQRPAPGRLGRRERGSPPRAPAPARGPRAGPARGHEFLDPILAPVRLGRRVLGRHRRAHHRARSIGSSARACRCRWASRARTDGNVQVAVDAVHAATVPRAFARRRRRTARAIHHARQRRLPYIILRGGRDAYNYDAAGVVSTSCSARPACPSGW